MLVTKYHVHPGIEEYFLSLRLKNNPINLITSVRVFAES